MTSYIILQTDTKHVWAHCSPKIQSVRSEVSKNQSFILIQCPKPETSTGISFEVRHLPFERLSGGYASDGKSSREKNILFSDCSRRYSGHKAPSTGPREGSQRQEVRGAGEGEEAREGGGGLWGAQGPASPLKSELPSEGWTENFWQPRPTTTAPDCTSELCPKCQNRADRQR